MDFIKGLIPSVKIPKIPKLSFNWSLFENNIITSLRTIVSSARETNESEKRTPTKNPMRISTVSSLVENTNKIIVSKSESSLRNLRAVNIPEKYDYKKENYGLYALKCDRNAGRSVLNIHPKRSSSNKKNVPNNPVADVMNHEKYSPCKRETLSVQSYTITLDDEYDEDIVKRDMFIQEKVEMVPTLHTVKAPPRKKYRPKPPLPKASAPVVVELHPKQSSVNLPNNNPLNELNNKNKIRQIDDKTLPQKIDIFQKTGDAFEDFDDYFQQTKALNNLDTESEIMCSKKTVKLNNKVIYINYSQHELGTELLEGNENLHTNNNSQRPVIKTPLSVKTLPHNMENSHSQELKKFSSISNLSEINKMFGTDKIYGTNNNEHEKRLGRVEQSYSIPVSRKYKMDNSELLSTATTPSEFENNYLHQISDSEQIKNINYLITTNTFSNELFFEGKLRQISSEGVFV